MGKYLLSNNDGNARIPLSPSIARESVEVSSDIDVRSYDPGLGPSTEYEVAQIELDDAHGDDSKCKDLPWDEDTEHGSTALRNVDDDMCRRSGSSPGASSTNGSAFVTAGSPSRKPSRETSEKRKKATPKTKLAKSEKDKNQAVRWRDLPNKRQLAILTLARLSEPLTQTSLQAYMFYQLRSFSPTLPDSAISAQVGVLQACFTCAQCLTAVAWGRVSDSDRGGRKRVLLVGLLGTGISCVGFGFARSFVWAMVFRVLGGALNGNVGVMRTMISEIVGGEKRLQSRAFLLLPMCFNVGVIIGPILGGVLADPVGSYPGVFGENSALGGKHGVWWLKHWPYLLPNLMSAIFLLLAASAVFFGLEETLESLRGRPDWGLTLSHSIATLYRRGLFKRQATTYSHAYTALNHTDDDDESAPNSAAQANFNSYELEANHPPRPSKAKTHPQSKKKGARPPLPFRSIFTPAVLTTLLAHSLLALHISTFNSLWFIFLSTPRADHNLPSVHHSPFVFTGGLGLQPRTIGLTLAILGTFGLTLQFALYPRLTRKWGTITTFRAALLCFPVAYALAPFLALLVVAPNDNNNNNNTSHSLQIWFWLALLGVLAVQVLGRTFALPGAIILVNECCPRPEVLGTVHGVAQSVSSAARTVGPLVGAWGFGRGLDGGVVGAVWWALAGVAVLGGGVGRWVIEGDGGREEVEVEGEGEGEKEVGVDGRVEEEEEEESR